jgi:hypothetical protein
VNIYERIALFYERLEALPAFTSHDHAMAEISRVLTEVEDEFSGVPRDPSDMPVVTGGRMYPPHPVYAKQTDIQGVTLYVQKGHRTYVGDGGAILINNRKTGEVEFQKSGIDGGGVEL